VARSTQRAPGSAHAAPRAPSGLERLRPVDSAPFRQPAHAVLVWGTIAFTWLLSLLPWRLWEFAPNLLLLVITCWAVNEPARVGLFTAFFFGLLMDVHDGTRLGVQGLSYIITVFGALLLARRIRHFSSVVQAVHMLPVFLLAEAIQRLAQSWLSAEWGGWAWTWSALLTAALWPLVDLLLHIRRLDDRVPDAH